MVEVRRRREVLGGQRRLDEVQHRQAEDGLRVRVSSLPLPVFPPTDSLCRRAVRLLAILLRHVRRVDGFGVGHRPTEEALLEFGVR